jgi:hypothetical protein
MHPPRREYIKFLKKAIRDRRKGRRTLCQSVGRDTVGRLVRATGNPSVRLVRELSQVAQGNKPAIRTAVQSFNVGNPKDPRKIAQLIAGTKRTQFLVRSKLIARAFLGDLEVGLSQSRQPVSA